MPKDQTHASIKQRKPSIALLAAAESMDLYQPSSVDTQYSKPRFLEPPHDPRYHRKFTPTKSCLLRSCEERPQPPEDGIRQGSLTFSKTVQVNLGPKLFRDTRLKAAAEEPIYRIPCQTQDEILKYTTFNRLCSAATARRNAMMLANILSLRLV